MKKKKQRSLLVFVLSLNLEKKNEFPIKKKVLINFKKKIFSESTNNIRNETKRRSKKRKNTKNIYTMQKKQTLKPN